MAALDITSASQALKVLYTGQKLNKLTYTDRPLLAMLTKMESFGGRNWPLPIQFSNPQGRSAVFATAQANKNPSQFREFLLTRSKDYALASISNEMIDGAKGDNDSFINLLENEIDSAYDTLSNALSVDLFGNGSGKRGRIAATQTLGATVVQLANVEDIVKFEVDMYIVASATDGTGSVKAGGGYIVAVDRDLGTFQLSATVGGAAAALNSLIATIAVSDFLFVAGDYGVKVKGLSAWVPDTAPTGGDNFFGVDRTKDVTRLAGVRFDGSAFTIEEAIQKGLSRLAREGGRPDKIVMNHEKMQDLILALGSKVQYIDVEVANVGFRGVRIHGAKSVVDVFADKDCPFDRAYMLTLKDWVLASLGRAPKILDQDGNRILRESGADAAEIRVGYYAQLGCKAPGHSGVILL